MCRHYFSGGTVNGNAPVAVNGPFNWSNGTINNTGGVTLNGTSSLSGVGTYVMQLYGLLINAGTLTWGGSGQNLYIAGGTLTNLATGTMNITADVASVAGGTIGNAGVLRKTGGTGTTSLGTVLVNSGDVQVQSGTLSMASGGSASGTFEVSANTTLQFGSSYTLSGASSVTGAGNAIFSSGTINASGTYNLTGINTFSGATVTFAGNYTLSGQAATLSAGAVNFNAGGAVNLTGLTLSGGTLGGTLPVSVNGPFSWSSGAINNTGGVTLNGTSSLSGVGNFTLVLAGLLVNAGPLTWGGSGQNLYVSSGTLTNLATGTITITADVSAVNGGGSGIGNAGVMRKTGGTGTTTLGVPFVNTGDVQVQSGMLSVTSTYNGTNGILRIIIFGAANYGHVAFGNALTLTGTLAAQLSGGYLPNDGDTFTLLTYPSRTGSFTTLNLPPEAVWQVTNALTAFVITASSVCTPPANGLVAWWPGEGSAGDLFGANDGTLSNGVTFAAGEVGQAFSFNGINQYVSTPIGVTNIANNFTMEFWAYPTAALAITTEANSGISGAGSQRYAIFPYQGGTQDSGAGVSVGTNGISIFEYGANFLPSPLVYQSAITGWTHVAVIYTPRRGSNRLW